MKRQEKDYNFSLRRIAVIVSIAKSGRFSALMHSITYGFLHLSEDLSDRFCAEWSHSICSIEILNICQEEKKALGQF